MLEFLLLGPSPKLEKISLSPAIPTFNVSANLGNVQVHLFFFLEWTIFRLLTTTYPKGTQPWNYLGCPYLNSESSLDSSTALSNKRKNILKGVRVKSISGSYWNNHILGKVGLFFLVYLSKLLWTIYCWTNAKFVFLDFLQPHAESQLLYHALSIMP